MYSLRIKLSLAFIVTSMAAVVLVGAITQWRVATKFDQMAMERAFENFQADVTAYIATYDSWGEAQKIERFGQFARRRRALVGDVPKDLSFPRPQNRMGYVGSNRPPPPVLSETGRPPFRFILLDPQGKVLMGAGIYKSGEYVSSSVRLKAIPITLEKQVMALAIPQGKPNLSHIDLGYLATIKEALMVAFFIASTFAILLGFIFSQRLSGSLHELTDAIRAMTLGELRQKVTVRSKDEIGVLAEAFNRMSADLAHAYEDLEQSNRTINEQTLLLKELSIRDELTQLYNRRHFNEQAAMLFTQMERFKHSLSFMMGDIDYFKQVNDKFSHATGDEVLKIVAEILQTNTRKCDIVARYGGEEFVIIFPETSLIQVIQRCEKLRQLIENYPWSTVQPELHITMSMGLNDDLTLDGFEQMLAVADNKLYQAKANGRNQLCY